jgi:hypothetical protein
MTTTPQPFPWGVFFLGVGVAFAIDIVFDVTEAVGFAAGRASRSSASSAAGSSAPLGGM